MGFSVANVGRTCYCENLLAVIANMYLLPGLRLYGLKLSQGEEMPEGWKKKERCLKTQKGAEKGNLFLWVF